MKKITTKFLCVALMLACLTTAGASAYAMDSRVTASSKWLDSKKDTGSYYHYRAAGYITAKENHYCSVQLYELGSVIKTSSRKWGTGKVSNTSAYSDSSALVSAYYGATVHYGF